MSQRFISNIALAIAIAGAVVVVVSQAFTSTVTGWVTFGVSLGALALLAVAERNRMGEPAQRLCCCAKVSPACSSARVSTSSVRAGAPPS